MRTERQGLIALLIVVAIWGTTFPTMKLLTGALDALQIIGARFVIALLVLAPVWRGLRRAELRWGLLLGVLLFIAFWSQTEGLARTSSNRNAFVTGLSVLIVPLLAMLVLGRRYGVMLWSACALALAGMALMFHEDAPWNAGDTLTLISTLFYAVYILLLEECARRNASAPLRAARLAAVQALVMCAASLALIWQRHGELSSTVAALAALGPLALASLLYLGVMASVLVVTLQAWGQQRVDAVRSAIVYGLEPVFAAATAWFLIDERMGPAALAGAALIVGALMVSQMPAPTRRSAPASVPAP